HLDRDPTVKPPRDPLAAIQAIELPRVEEVEHAARARAGLGLHVGHRPFARADREVEAETVALQPPPAARQRPHPAPLAEDGAAHVAAVAEVPHGLRQLLLASVCTSSSVLLTLLFGRFGVHLCQYGVT